MCGLNNALIQKRLLSERDLTSAKATQIALSMEAAAKDSLELKGKNESEVNKLNKEKGKVENARDEVRSKRPCYRCGSNLHSSEECHFKNENCRKCGKVGHIQRVCRSGRNQRTTDLGKPKKVNQKLHSLGVDKELDDDSLIGSLYKSITSDRQSIMTEPKDGAGYRFSDIHTTFSEIQGIVPKNTPRKDRSHSENILRRKAYTRGQT